MSAFNRWSSGDKNIIPPPRSRSVVVTADPVIVYQTRAPVFTPLPKNRQAGFTDVAVNLLLTTLAVGGAVQPPFFQTDWPNPPRPAQVRQVEPQPNLLLSTLAQPFRQSDWPNPAKLRPPPQPEIPQSCLGLDSSKGIPFQQRDWPNPQPPQAPPQWTAPYFRQYDPCPAGPYYGATGVNDAVEGDVAWSSPQDGVRSDDVYASAILVAQTTQRLNITGFGFNIDPAKRIAGIVVEIEAKQLLGGGSQRIRLLKAGVLQTPSKFSIWDTTEAFFSVGASTDLWLNSWTPADINDPNFGVSIRNSAGATDTLSVDSVRVTVYCADIVFSQLDWPNPKIRPVVQPDNPPNLLCSTLSTVQAPFVQSDWPNPKAIKVVQPDVFQSMITLDRATNPFFQTDWPNPPLKISQQPEIPQSLITLDRATNPFKQLDWPVPPIRRSIQPDIPQNCLALDSSKGVTFRQTDWPNPARQISQQPEIPQSLITLDRATNPFKQTNWPNPVPQKTAPIDNPPNLLGTTLATAAVQAPFAQYDWRNPAVQKSLQVDVAQSLITLDRATNPFKQIDWPNPALKITQQPEIPQSLITLDRATNPFKQTEWPNPVPQKTAPIDNPPNLLGTTLATAAVQAPFSQNDWPSPPNGPPSRIPQMSSYRLSFGAPDAGKPFLQTEWPNPIPARKAPPQFDPPNLQTLVFAPVPPPPFQQTNWPIPPKRVEASTELHVLNLALGTMPFRQNDWAILALRPPLKLYDPPNLQTTTFVPVVQLPFAQYDWPNPKGPTFAWRYNFTSSGNAILPIPGAAVALPNQFRDTRRR